MCGPPSPAANCPGERVEGNRTLPLISLGVVDGDWVYPSAHPSCTPLKLGEKMPPRVVPASAVWLGEPREKVSRA